MDTTIIVTLACAAFTVLVAFVAAGGSKAAYGAGKLRSACTRELDPRLAPSHAPLMRYEEFRAVWEAALQESGLAGGEPEETLDVRRLSRNYQVFVEPVGGQHAEPLFVTAKLSFRWDAIHTARAATNEHDFLTQIVGGDRASKTRTERPWVRADIVLSATLPYGKPIPMPAPRVWAKWVEETMVRLDDVERLAPEEVLREKKNGRHEILAWSAEQPSVETVCGFDGKLLVTGIELAAWEGVQLPRVLDEDRRQDPDPAEQLRGMFARVRASLYAWMEVMDHLTLGQSGSVQVSPRRRARLERGAPGPRA